MPTPKLFTRQFQSADGKTYIFNRYWDDHNNNYEYQVYELVVAKKVARKFNAPDMPAGGNAANNSRTMCNWVWDNVEPME